MTDDHAISPLYNIQILFEEELDVFQFKAMRDGSLFAAYSLDEFNKHYAWLQERRQADPSRRKDRVVVCGEFARQIKELMIANLQ